MKNTEDNEEGYYGVGAFIFEMIKVIILAVIIIVPVRIFLFQPFLVQGASMEPTFENSEYLIVNELGYKKTEADFGDKNVFTIDSFKDISRQAVIVFHYPKDRSQFFIKRIIGLPDEKIEIRDGKIVIYNSEHPDGFQLDESTYLASSVKTKGDLTLTLKADEYFVMGDNRPASSDSRAWGPIKKSDVVGNVMLRAWPLNRMNIF
jgi:signal peptidase I